MNEDKVIENPYAFPSRITDNTINYWEGMTLRDYFAAKAMQAFIATPTLYDTVNNAEQAAAASYQVAEAMLKERSK